MGGHCHGHGFAAGSGLIALPEAESGPPRAAGSSKGSRTSHQARVDSGTLTEFLEFSSAKSVNVPLDPGAGMRVAKQRHAIRAILLTPHNEVLLMKIHEPGKF